LVSPQPRSADIASSSAPACRHYRIDVCAEAASVANARAAKRSGAEAVGRRLLGASLVRVLAAFLAVVLWAVLPAGQAAEPSAAGQSAAAVGGSADLVPVPEPSEQTLRYYRSGNVLWVVSTLWGLLVPVLILFSGLSARLRDMATAFSILQDQNLAHPCPGPL
jgi:hypothetical protein